MATRLNLYCNGTLRKEAHEKWQKKFDKINFPGALKRDKFGIIIKEKENDKDS